ncbi:mandelate racemase/muconate lactonizing enzyme family protein [Citricoccus nitrophenolicus]|uniref:mandelate racemase/muconate lactonizing enzyme family protein n=1 Tax=Citricoccus nitrophenolicus TaxID=863575 RepID=UPI0039B37AA0
MKIENIDTWILRVPFLRETADFDDAHHELIGVTVHSEGLTGMGYSFITDHAGGTSVKALLDDLLVPHVLRRDASQPERIWNAMEDLTHRMGTGINRFAMASIDIALWDLKAKSNGHSLAAEIGQVTDDVPVYGSGKAGGRLSVDELVQLSQEYVDSGFHAVKIRVGRDPDEDPARIAAVRSALGDHVKIMIDANERLSYSSALSLGRQLAEHDIFWFEEPVVYTDRRSHVELARHLPMPIVGGEHHCSSAAFLDYVTERAFTMVQPNVCMVGGVTEMVRIMRLAESHGVGFAPHLMTDLNVHLAAATNSTVYVEYFPFLEPYTSNRLEIANGRATVPTAAGHGILFTDETFAKYRIA